MVYFFFKRLCAYKWFPHSRSLNNQQQKVEQVSTAYGAQTHTRPETNPSLGALDSLPDFRESDGSCNLPVFLMSLFSSHCHLMCPPSSLFFPSIHQTCGSGTWWNWCWRSPYRRCPNVSATCCCDRLGFYWVCSTATSLCERSVRLMSTGDFGSRF